MPTLDSLQARHVGLAGKADGQNMCAGVATAVRPIKSSGISSDMGIEARRFVMQSLRVCLCRDPVPATSPVRDDPTNIF